MLLGWKESLTNQTGLRFQQVVVECTCALKISFDSIICSTRHFQFYIFCRINSVHFLSLLVWQLLSGSIRRVRILDA